MSKENGKPGLALGNGGKQIKINCTGTKFVDYKKLSEFQEDIKKISSNNLGKLKQSILDQGFILPFCIWDNYILDGHQRKKALIELSEEGYIIPELPAIEINAKSKQKAKQIILSLTSQHGEFDKQKLQLYIESYNIELKNIVLINTPIILKNELENDDESDHIRLPFNDERDNLELKELLGLYDLIAIAFSGGKDSVAMALKIRELGFSDKSILTYCHVPLFACDNEKEYIKNISDEIGIRLEILETDESEEMIIEKLKKRGYPGRMLNWCHSDYKVTVMNKYYRLLDSSYIMAIGTRSEESPRRAKQRSRGILSGRDFIFPIFNMKTEEIVKYINSYNIHIHPMYKYLNRYSCATCYQQTKMKWKIVKKHFPEEYEKALKLYTYSLKSDKFRNTEYSVQLLENIILEPNKEIEKLGLKFNNFWSYKHG